MLREILQPYVQLMKIKSCAIFYSENKLGIFRTHKVLDALNRKHKQDNFKSTAIMAMLLRDLNPIFIKYKETK